MKSAFLITAVLLFVNVLIGQNYIPFPTDSAVWNNHYDVNYGMGWSNGAVWQELVGGDTLVDGNLTQKVVLKTVCTYRFSDGILTQVKTDFPETHLIGCIREENKKVYFKKFEPQYFEWEPYVYAIPAGQEILLYDFTLDLNDTFSLAYSNRVFKITSVETINGRKRYRLVNMNGINWYTDVYEGMGSDHGLFGVYDQLGWQPDFDILCLTVGGEFLSGAPPCDCPYTVPTIETSLDKVVVIPNPSVNGFCVLADTPTGSFDLSVWDLQGHLLQRIDNLEIEFCIDWAQLSGVNVVLVKVEVPGQGYVLKKVIRAY